MNGIIQAVLAILTQVAALLDSPGISAAINALSSLVPFLYNEARDLYPTVKLAIDALRGNGTVTPEQLDQLDVIEAKLDAVFETALAAAKAEDAAG